MPEQPADPDRRRFIRLATGGVIAAPLGALLAPRAARAVEAPRLDPGSKRARELGYTPDATSSDDPKRKDGASCRNCVHFRGDDGAAWAPCNIFPQHRVSGGGWCQAWVGAS